MNRREAMLRELHLYPLWQLRKSITETAGERAASAPSAEVAQNPAAVMPVQTSSLSETEHAAAYHAVREDGRSEEGVDAASEEPGPAARREAAVTPVVASGDGDARAGHIGTLPWPELKQMVHDCTACRLRAGCTQTVFGVGDEGADWLFVGEGPGADEDIQGEPFVGQAGKLLDSMLAAIRLKRGDNVYIANVVKCRPPNNRNPAEDEIASCYPYLRRQIQLIRPKLIVALGKVAATTLLGRDATLGSMRGRLHDYHGIPLLVTYHPAYLLRSPLEKAKAWEDLCLAVRVMDGEGK